MKCAILLLLCAGALANEDKTLGMSEANPASSCNEIYQYNPTSRGIVDQYWIKTNEGLFKVTCNINVKYVYITYFKHVIYNTSIRM